MAARSGCCGVVARVAVFVSSTWASLGVESLVVQEREKAGCGSWLWTKAFLDENCVHSDVRGSRRDKEIDPVSRRPRMSRQRIGSESTAWRCDVYVLPMQ